MSGDKDWKVKGLFDQSRFFLGNVLLKHFYALGLGKDNFACFGVGLYVQAPLSLCQYSCGWLAVMMRVTDS